MKLRIVDSNGRTVAGPKETSVKDECGANPVWNEEVVFDGLETPGAYTLVVTVLDKDSVLGIDALDCLAADDKLGKADFDLGTLSKTDKWQDKTLIVVDGWFSDSTVNLSLSTCGDWGN